MEAIIGRTAFNLSEQGEVIEDRKLVEDMSEQDLTDISNNLDSMRDLEYEKAYVKAYLEGGSELHTPPVLSDDDEIMRDGSQTVQCSPATFMRNLNACDLPSVEEHEEQGRKTNRSLLDEFNSICVTPPRGEGDLPSLPETSPSSPEVIEIFID